MKNLAFALPLVLLACSGAPSDPFSDTGVGGTYGTGGGGNAVASGGAISSGGSVASGGAILGSGSSVATGGAIGSGGAVNVNCGPDWIDGANYTAGSIVRYPDNGLYYIATNENPGYDPTISTWFWSSYTCTTAGTGGSTSSGGSASGGSSSGGSSSGGSSSSGFAGVVSSSQFDQMFPPKDRNAFYTYADLVAATAKYPAFANTGDVDTRKREAAAFLANVAQETGFLKYIDQIAQDTNCEWRSDCACEAGKKYFGRGPIQITWNYNYCMAGDALGWDLRKNPELVSQNDEIAWATGLWFWMTQTGAGTYVPHTAMVNAYGFGETIEAINGGIECTPLTDNGQRRINNYLAFCAILGVSPGSTNGC